MKSKKRKIRPKSVEHSSKTVSIIAEDGREILIDERDDDLCRHNWRVNPGGYAYTTIRWRSGWVLMHREIMDPPKGKVVDHINGNPLDNRRCNLRVCTQSQNLMNMRKTRGTSQYKGVYLAGPRWPGVWKAGIKVKGKILYLGMFKTEVAAAVAYNDAAAIHFGEFAKFNTFSQMSVSGFVN